MSDVMEAEPVVGSIVFAKPTMNYRRVMRPGGVEIFERCWIVEDKLEWREVPCIDGEIVG